MRRADAACRAGPHQLGAGARLPKAAPGEQQPDAPLARGRQLVGPRPETPIVQDRNCLIRGQRADQLIPQDCRQRTEPAGVQALHARPPPGRLRGCSCAVAAPSETCRDAARIAPSAGSDKAMRACSTSTRSTVNAETRAAFHYFAGIARSGALYFGGGVSQVMLVERGTLLLPPRRVALTPSQCDRPRSPTRPIPSWWRSYIRSIRICQHEYAIYASSGDCQNVPPTRRARRREFRTRFPG